MELERDTELLREKDWCEGAMPVEIGREGYWGLARYNAQGGEAAVQVISQGLDYMQLGMGARVYDFSIQCETYIHRQKSKTSGFILSIYLLNYNPN